MNPPRTQSRLSLLIVVPLLVSRIAGAEDGDPKVATPLVSATTGMKLVRIPAGEYLRGTNVLVTDAGDEEKPQHRVRITKDYYLGMHEVTQGEWKIVMGTEPWKGQKPAQKEGKDYPATNVSWNQTQDYCRRLSQKDGHTYRLPTEAEWEYACRAGSTTRYSFGDKESQLGDYAWYGIKLFDKPAEAHPRQVGLKKANAFGLHDMHGNVWEMCSDWYHDDEYVQHTGKTAVDPHSEIESRFRAARGGGYANPPSDCCSACRRGYGSETAINALGFRVAATE